MKIKEVFTVARATGKKRRLVHQWLVSTEALGKTARSRKLHVG